MIEISIFLAGLAVYRGALAATSNAPAGSMRARLNQALGGGGPGPVIQQ